MALKYQVSHGLNAKSDLYTLHVVHFGCVKLQALSYDSACNFTQPK